MNRALILEAVEALRLRKCRPEREAIAHHVLKKHGIQFQEIFHDLEQVVDQGDLIKVEYKGTTSYRSPQSFDIQQNPLLTKHSKILNSNKTIHLILCVVQELITSNEPYSEEGIPRDTLTLKLIEYDPSRFTTTSTPIYIDREIAVGALVVGHQKRILPKHLILPDSKFLQGKKMRGRKPKATTQGQAQPVTQEEPAMESAPAGCGGGGDGAVEATPETPPTTTEVFAVKSTPVPVVSPPPAKPARLYGRKSAPEKAEESTDSNKNGGDKVPPTTPEDTSTGGTPTGRSVRNKRKKEVFDPSDLPKKKISTTPVSAKTEKEKPVSAKKATVTSPSPIKTPKKPGRKKKVVDETPTPEKGATSAQCEHCQKHKNAKGQVEGFIVCADCSSKYHPSCLEYDKKHASILIEKGTWQCLECKACQVCQGQSSKGPETILCSSCDMGFHYKCLKLTKKQSEDSWLCPICTGDEKVAEENIDAKPEELEATGEKSQLDGQEIEMKQEEAEVGGEKSATEDEAVSQAPKKKQTNRGRPPKKRIITLNVDKEEEPELVTAKKNNVQVDKKKDNDDTELIVNKVEEMDTQPIEVKPSPAAAAAPPQQECSDDAKEEKTEDDDGIPSDASKWTPAHVEAYFKKHGLREEGALFRAQEIDGISLLIIKKTDIVHGMKLLLGPALKVFKLVVKLQQSGGKIIIDQPKTIL